MVALPRWRGGLVRRFDAFPRTAMPLAGTMLALGRAGQRRQARRLAARHTPTGSPVDG
ncbi:hypothetical protein KZZ52_00790 [Dactylosporangium sp. AC04546]|uniref:hypothetical protein n=1 Tax=Dactylosporangium sp. AC04546 TaxID=2862460 RepID=UPI001EDFE2DA|nr:hypothetical protein [Dactylosporangium sp. AC04546]WVK84019.1 hypothetical protein KZZ52_00790 [Dactylosporangium sp. AC04546]